jgi:hypothetical protein
MLPNAHYPLPNPPPQGGREQAEYANSAHSNDAGRFHSQDVRYSDPAIPAARIIFPQRSISDAT